MELTDRKRQILKIVVEEYVAAAEPVGSKAIAQRMPGKISSATIRNELADLTEMGYLEQPHTSAGRVPSAKGYRLYVNELMERRSLSREEEEKLNTSLAEKLAGTDQVMARAGQMVSSFVGYPAYTVADHKTAATVRRFELIPVDQSSFIAVVMLSDSQVKSQLLPLQLPVADGGLPDMSHLLNTHFTGIGPEDMNGRLMSLSEQVSGQWFLPLNQVVEYAGRLLKEANSQEVFTGGAKEFLRFPEYRDADKAHDLMTFMVDNKEQLPAPTEGGPVQILIGPENLNEALRDLAKSYKEAQIAIEVGKVFDTEKYVVSYENLGIGRLIYQLPTTLCEMFLQEVFKKNPIDSLDKETLFTINKFFENNLVLSETARKLFVHRNTLVYRLEKIKKLTGLDLREFDDAITFKVALMVKKYLASRGIEA